ncbi:MAG: GatB/YqeY domain-containing protein [Nitrospirae bacterium]|nr:MAG: GatB/YqeY domain-containing protein [Nitrospirota bacterium]
MTIKEKIDSDLKEALKSGDSLSVSILRLLKSAIKNKEIEKSSPLSDEDVLSVLSSQAKQLREAISEYEKAGRHELAEKERKELSVLQRYLPEQLSEEELRKLIAEVIAETGASTPRDMGKVMKTLMPRVKGRADGKVVNQMVKEMLSSG